MVHLDVEAAMRWMHQALGSMFHKRQQDDCPVQQEWPLSIPALLLLTLLLLVAQVCLLLCWDSSKSPGGGRAQAPSPAAEEEAPSPEQAPVQSHDELCLDNDPLGVASTLAFRARACDKRALEQLVIDSITSGAPLTEADLRRRLSPGIDDDEEEEQQEQEQPPPPALLPLAPPPPPPPSSLVRDFAAQLSAEAEAALEAGTARALATLGGVLGAAAGALYPRGTAPRFPLAQSLALVAKHAAEQARAFPTSVALTPPTIS